MLRLLGDMLTIFRLRLELATFASDALLNAKIMSAALSDVPRFFISCVISISLIIWSQTGLKFVKPDRKTC